MVVFNSNADEIKHYIIELLSDGQEHTRSEIINYIIEKSGRTDFTDGNYSGSLNDLVRKRQIENVKRGTYRMTGHSPLITASQEIYVDDSKTLNSQCVEILQNTIIQLSRTANKVNVLEITEEELEIIQNIKKVITSLTTDIKLFEKT